MLIIHRASRSNPQMVCLMHFYAVMQFIDKLAYLKERRKINVMES